MDLSHKRSGASGIGVIFIVLGFVLLLDSFGVFDHLGSSSSTTTTVCTGVGISSDCSTISYTGTEVILQVSVPATGTTGTPVTFGVSSQLGSPVYTWSFGDGTTETGSSVQHTYAAAGTYVYTVSAQGQGEDYGAATGSITITGSVTSTTTTTSTTTGTTTTTVTTGSTVTTSTITTTSTSTGVATTALDVVTVVTAQTDAAVSGASIKLVPQFSGPPTYTATANEYGQATFQVVPGTYLVEVTATGFTDYTTTQTVGSSGAAITVFMGTSTGCVGNICPESILGGTFGGTLNEGLVGVVAMAVGVGLRKK